MKIMVKGIEFKDKDDLVRFLIDLDSMMYEFSGGSCHNQLEELRLACMKKLEELGEDLQKIFC